jgi:hypothetical protein
VHRQRHFAIQWSNKHYPRVFLPPAKLLLVDRVSQSVGAFLPPLLAGPHPRWRLSTENLAF